MQWSVSEIVSVVALVYSIISPFVVWFAASKVIEWRLQRAEQDIRDLRNWRHDHCEPAVRYVQFLKTERDTRHDHGRRS